METKVRVAAVEKVEGVLYHLFVKSAVLRVSRSLYSEWMMWQPNLVHLLNAGRSVGAAWSLKI